MKQWKFDITNGLARLTLQTGIKGNRLNPSTFEELNEILINLDTQEVRGLILDAHGKDFSQGFDLTYLLSSNEMDLKAMDDIFLTCNLALDNLYHLPIPTLSLIQGSCIGGGFLMALATDFRAAHINSRFGFPEVKQSLVVNLGLKRVYQLLGESKTKELVLLGEPISSEKLMNWGVINWVSSEDHFTKQIELFQNYLNAIPPVAFAANKNLIQKIPNLNSNESMQLENKLQAQVLKSEDFKEALRSFLEKRKPIYKGK